MPTTVLLNIDANPAIAPRSLLLWLYDTSGRVIDAQRLPAKGDVVLPGAVVLYPPADRGLLRILVRGVDDQNARIGEGVTQVMPQVGQQVHAAIHLSPTTLPDADGDGVPDAIDTCPRQPNPLQKPCTEDASSPETRHDIGPDGQPGDQGSDLGEDQGDDAPTPDTFKPDTLKPDTFKPDTFKLDTFKLDTFKPDALRPDAIMPLDLPQTDAPPSDTTLSPDSAPPACALSGTYTIDRSTVIPGLPKPFKSFAEAFAKLKACGVKGPTTFLVKADSYNEAGFIFPIVPYASPAATVHFVASGSVNLVGTSSAMGQGSAVITIAAGAHDLVIEGFEIDGKRSGNRLTGSHTGPVLFDPLGGQQRVTLRKLEIHHFRGSSWGTSNHIGAIYVGIAATSAIEEIVIDGCYFHDIEPPSSASVQGGICFVDGTRNRVIVKGCRFEDITTMPSIFFSGGTHPGRAFIINNMFALTDDVAALKFFNAPVLNASLYLVYNTIYATNIDATGLVGTVSAAGTGTLFVRNNILLEKNKPFGGSKTRLITTVPPKLAEDHNCLGNAITGLASPSSTDVFALPRLANTSGSPYDLHSTAASPCLDKALPMPTMTVDFDGDARDANTPDIGADEL
ncbi:MAG: hypothetical protein KAI47_26800 [Deltaproteobacteria bacterium]|nr:hypothetical protein [Deltaproteobacteria bacterium]